MEQELIEVSKILNTYPKFRNKLPMKILIGLFLHHSLAIILFILGISLLNLFTNNNIDSILSQVIYIILIIIVIKKIKDFKREYNYIKEWKKIATYTDSYKDYCYVIDENRKTYKQYDWFQKNVLRIHKINYLEKTITHIEKTARPQLEIIKIFN